MCHRLQFEAGLALRLWNHRDKISTFQCIQIVQLDSENYSDV